MSQKSSDGKREMERRSETRYPARRTVEILPCRGRNEWKFLRCQLADASMSGISIVLGEPMDQGEQFLIKLRTVSGVRMLLYTVRSCSPCDRSHYRIGALFSRLVAQPLDENPQIILESLLTNA